MEWKGATTVFGAGRGRRGLRIGLAGQAVRLDSSCVGCYVTGSELLAAKGNLRAAVAARRGAIALAGERVEPSEQQRLRQLERLLAQQPGGDL